MEAKKYSKYDLSSKRNLFFNIGLALSMGLVVGMMEWKSYEKAEMLSLNGNASDFEEIMEVPLTEQPPPPPPKVTKSVNIIEVPDIIEIEEEIEVNLDIDITEDTKIEDVVLVDDFEEPAEEEAEIVFTIVEEQPVPVGGYEQFYQYVAENLRYPMSALRLGIEGKVYVQFVVDEKGKISHVEVIKGISKDCDNEAIRVLRNAPDWKPGKQRGRSVKVRMIIPITFIIDKSQA